MSRGFVEILVMTDDLFDLNGSFVPKVRSVVLGLEVEKLETCFSFSLYLHPGDVKQRTQPSTL